MSVWAAGISIAVSAASAATGAIQSSNAADAQKKAQQQALANAKQQQSQADQQYNQAHQKAPDTNAILAAAQQSGKTGTSGTMLTGSGGIDTNSLSLGKSTLLGQ